MSTTENPVVELKSLSKRFGNVVALKDLNLSVYEGDIYGFIGPNGAGKTTALKIIATLLRPDHGTVTVAGRSVSSEPRMVRRAIGYMPDVLGFYRGLTVEEYLDFFAAAYRVGLAKRSRLIGDLLALTDLEAKRTVLVTSLSRGMQQRLGLARALIHDPRVLLLDEPASGLDPRARVEIRELLRELAGMGKTILISSHVLSDLEEIANRVGIIEQGKLLYSGPKDEALNHVQEHAAWEVVVRESAEAARKLLERHRAVKTVTIQGNLLLVTMSDGVGAAVEIPALLINNGFSLVHYTRRAVRLEDVFLSITEGKVQ